MPTKDPIIMICFYLMKALPLLTILKIITTSRNFTAKKKNKQKKHPTNKQVKLTEEWYKTNYVFYVWIIKILEYSTKMNQLRRETCTHTHLYIQPVCNSKDHLPSHPPPPSPHFPSYNYTLRLNETKSCFIFVKTPLCDIFFYWNICFYVRKKRKKTAGAQQNQVVEILLNYYINYILTRSANYLQKFALS